MCACMSLNWFKKTHMDLQMCTDRVCLTVAHAQPLLLPIVGVWETLWHWDSCGSSAHQEPRSESPSAANHLPTPSELTARCRMHKQQVVAVFCFWMNMKEQLATEQNVIELSSVMYFELFHRLCILPCRCLQCSGMSWKRWRWYLVGCCRLPDCLHLQLPLCIHTQNRNEHLEVHTHCENITIWKRRQSAVMTLVHSEDVPTQPATVYSDDIFSCGNSRGENRSRAKSSSCAQKFFTCSSLG